MNWLRRSGMMDEAYVKKAKKQPIALPPSIDQIVPPRPRDRLVRICDERCVQERNAQLRSSKQRSSSLTDDNEILVSPTSQQAPSTPSAPQRQGQQQHPDGGGAAAEAETVSSPFTGARYEPGTTFKVQQDPATLQYANAYYPHDPEVEGIVAFLNNSNLDVVASPLGRSPTTHTAAVRRGEGIGNGCVASPGSPGADSLTSFPHPPRTGRSGSGGEPFPLASSLPSRPLFCVSDDLQQQQQQHWQPATTGSVIRLMDRSPKERDRIRAEQRASYKRQMKLCDPPIIVRFPEIEMDEQHEAELRKWRAEQSRNRQLLSSNGAATTMATLPPAAGEAQPNAATNGSSHTSSSSGHDGRKSSKEEEKGKAEKKQQQSLSAPSSPYASPTGRTVKQLPPTLKRDAADDVPSTRPAPVYTRENTAITLPRLCTMGITLLDFVEGVIELRVLQMKKQLADPPVGAPVADPYTFARTRRQREKGHDGDNGVSAEGRNSLEEEKEEEEEEEVYHFFHPSPFTYTELTENPQLLPEVRRREMRAAVLGKRTTSPEVYGGPARYSANGSNAAPPSVSSPLHREELMGSNATSMTATSSLNSNSNLSHSFTRAPTSQLAQSNENGKTTATTAAVRNGSGSGGGGIGNGPLSAPVAKSNTNGSNCAANRKDSLNGADAGNYYIYNMKQQSLLCESGSISRHHGRSGGSSVHSSAASGVPLVLDSVTFDTHSSGSGTHRGNSAPTSAPSNSLQLLSPHARANNAQAPRKTLDQSPTALVSDTRPGGGPLAPSSPSVNATPKSKSHPTQRTTPSTAALPTSSGANASGTGRVTVVYGNGFLSSSSDDSNNSTTR